MSDEVKIALGKIGEAIQNAGAAIEIVAALLGSDDQETESHPTTRDMVAASYNRLRDAGAITMSVDSLPYTSEFELVYAEHEDLGSRHDVWVPLMNARKAGMCPAPRKNFSREVEA